MRVVSFKLWPAKVRELFGSAGDGTCFSNLTRTATGITSVRACPQVQTMKPRQQTTLAQMSR
eukprot:727336-Amphidinium_carterae.1